MTPQTGVTGSADAPPPADLCDGLLCAFPGGYPRFAVTSDGAALWLLRSALSVSIGTTTGLMAGVLITVQSQLGERTWACTCRQQFRPDLLQPTETTDHDRRLHH